MTKVAILGSGTVGDALAKGFLGDGHQVMRGTREPAKLAAWQKEAGANASVGTFADAAAWGELVVLAVKGTAAEACVDQAGAKNLAGKTVIDATNPIADAPPDHGVLRYFTTFDQSLMERLVARAPEANFVKAFSCVGNAFMVRPDFGGARPSMFICGDSDAAKAEVGKLLDAWGWETEDMGGAASARAIEPLCILWCLPGFLKNDWAHAFKVLRK
ncbi:MAG TPA: NAD(P)-binding domain-containing protein [Kofleriaceae bacterium]|nr:NAD(P)-binding domain-containing protein [Kofleriaceae bacterium]